MEMSPAPVEVFFSFAEADVSLLKRLENHLSVLVQEGVITTWNRRQIVVGSDWQKEMDSHLDTASLILFLISPDFLASGYQYGVEFQRAIQRYDANQALVIPILLRPCDWAHTPFGNLLVIPRNGKAVTSWRYRDEAFVNIAGEIRVALEDAQQLTDNPLHARLPEIWNVPYGLNPFFTGREEYLIKLHTQLQNTQVTAIGQSQAISGLGGVGKTQLAVRYAHHYRSEYQVVLWAQAENRETLTASFTDIAHRLKLFEKNEQEPSMIIQAVKQWLQQQGDWLLILDNADTPGLLVDFIPQTICGHLLLTTRASEVHIHLPSFAHPLKVECFSDEIGALFLLHRSRLLPLDAMLDQAEAKIRDLALAITHELGGLPLALDQAGAYLKTTDCGLVTYLQLCQTHYTQLLNERRGADHPKPVATTWNLSFQEIEQRKPAAADLLRFCAFLDPDSIFEEIITVGAQEPGSLLSSVAADAYLLNEAIEVLHAYSLITRDPHTQVLTMHRLVQAVLKEQMDKETRQQWAEQAIRALNAVLPPMEPKNWSAWERLMPHVRLCPEYIEYYHMQFSAATDVLNKAGLYLAEHAQYIEAERLFQLCRNILKQNEHPDSLLTQAIVLRNLANVYSEIADYPEAERLYKESLTIFELHQNLDRRQFACLMDNMAIIFKVQNKYEEAEELYQSSLSIWSEWHELLNYAQSLNNRAVLYGEQEDISKYGLKYATATHYLKLSLKIQIEELGDNSDVVARSFNNLANLYMKQARNNRITPSQLLKLSQELQEQQLGEDLEVSAQRLHDIAASSIEQGQKYIDSYQSTLYMQARKLYLRSFRILVKNKGRNHPDVGYPLNGLGIFYFQHGELTKAESCYKRSLEIWEQSLSQKHPQSAYARNNLSLIYLEQKKYEKAELFCEKASKTFHDSLGKGHPHIQVCDENLRKIREALKKQP